MSVPLPHPPTTPTSPFGYMIMKEKFKMRHFKQQETNLACEQTSNTRKRHPWISTISRDFKGRGSSNEAMIPVSQ